MSSDLQITLKIDSWKVGHVKTFQNRSRVNYETGFAPEKFESIDCRFGRETMGENYPLVS